MTRRFVHPNLYQNLVNEYDRIVKDIYGGNYVKALEDFAKENIFEHLRNLTNDYYKKLNRKDKNPEQAFKSAIGSIYEYAVFRALQYLIERLNLALKVSLGTEEILENIIEQIAFRNWEEIMPDIDILLYSEKPNKRVLAIFSCKTSLRERLTESAFWKKVLEQRNPNIKYIFVTTNKDEEIENKVNRFMILHILDYTIITDIDKCKITIENWKKKYGHRPDFEILMKKVKSLRGLCKLLCEFQNEIEKIDIDKCKKNCENLIPIDKNNLIPINEDC